MRKISGTYVFSITSGEIRFGVLSLKNNQILEIIDPGENFREISSLEYFNGIVFPGFVCVHISSGHSEEFEPNSTRLIFDRGANVLARLNYQPGKSEALVLIDIVSLNRNKTTGLKVRQDKYVPVLEKNGGMEYFFSVQHERTGENWYFITPNELRCSEPLKLLPIIRKIRHRLIFSWGGDTTGFGELLEFMLHPDSGLKINEVLATVTHNPAQFLGIQDEFGSLKAGISPGVLLLEGMNLKEMSVIKGKIKPKRLA